VPYSPGIDFLLLGLILLLPASIVFIIMTIIRVRRARFHRQRIKRSSKPEE
jgi:hypothetical protein